MGFLGEYLSPENPLPTAPPEFDYANHVGAFPMALNNTLGDCTIAGVIHLLQLAYGAIDQTFEYPGDDAVRSTYMELTGGADSGLAEADVLAYWQQNGLFGTKLAAFAPIHLRDTQLLQDACFAFGGLYLGVELPQNAETQFQEGEPWHVVNPPQAPIGGHCITASGFGNDGDLAIETWGEETSATADWWATYGSEAWVILPEAWIEAGHGVLESLSISALTKDMELLGRVV